MSVLPVDLQVLFTKAADVSASVAKNASLVQSAAADGIEKNHKQSNEINEKVSSVDEYAEDFTKVNEEGGGQQQTAGHHKKKKENEQEAKEYKRAPKEDGTGRIIDIID